MRILAVTLTVVMTPGNVMVPTPHGVALDFSPQPLSPLSKLKVEALRFAGSGNREDFKLVERLFGAVPELRCA